LLLRSSSFCTDSNDEEVVLLNITAMCNVVALSLTVQKCRIFDPVIVSRDVQEKKSSLNKLR